MVSDELATEVLLVESGEWEVGAGLDVVLLVLFFSNGLGSFER